MYSSIDYTLKEKQGAKYFIALSCEMLGSGTFFLHVHSVDDDDCYGIDLTPKMARDLASQLIHFAKVAEDSKTSEGGDE